MNWENILITFAFMVLGYLIGSVISSIILTRHLSIEDVRNSGSKNAGATNTRRVHGSKIALIVFFIDITKPIIAMLIPWLIFNNGVVFVPAVGVAAIIGHIFPIFFNFKGGKGAASLLGYVIVMSWPLAIIGFFIFAAILKKTKKVSIGSIFTPFILFLLFLVGYYIPHYWTRWSATFLFDFGFWSVWITYGLIVLIVILAHHENIKRLLSGKENSVNKIS